ncbi:hypothetical protein EAX61_09330 [Dokdonia sinensis]|uniref:Uncharacterized protein n=1 Tax=Dokdonia sinensis TaxID=2479847 RepID=A0A3M0G1Q2_9FLAO|nr:DUF6503 family protein [Dokdonia sinensis]RMB58498.1 hypothetical protein EAX61_09330 [Dokdonia sinensis]
MRLTILCLFIVLTTSAQNFTGAELLEKAIAYHDPYGTWDTFKGEFLINMEMPGKPDRESIITIDLPNQYFNLSTNQGGKTSFREITGNSCRFSNEDETITETTVAASECELTVMFKNYYTYLYGLPMKLKDPGTNINSEVQKVTFKGKEYLKLRATYDEAVGSDIWQFYFNPETYAMEVYQFFKGTDEKTGEYILLTDEVVINQIKFPKDRAWYYNKDNGYLATDKLVIKE